MLKCFYTKSIFICGFEPDFGKRAFGVQYHAEASPGPQDNFYLFEKFVGGL